ncbi:hypothetical protein QR680_016915 [Steinernema hermaphroditum]|uniref:F-box domain-containing protein n=1 Tax=Steinernema hermaphroditum TaxID=289476 RepID=A0AA39HF52_9BILA|nr:hypothetical protein QR680_016915 [Steinernema hermaphroditum]
MSVKRKKPSTYLDVLLDEYDQQNANLSGGPRPKRSKVREVVLPVEILRRICSYLTDSRDLAAFTAVNHACLTAALLEKQKTLLPDGVLDIKRTFFNNPFNPVAVKQILHCRHNNLYVGYALMRQRMEYLCKALESHLESTEFTDGIKSLRNFDLRSLQLFSNFCACSQSTVVPTDLQKRLKKIIKSLSSLECVGLPTALLKPKRFFQAIEKKFDSLVSLDLQHVAQTESINLYDAFGAAHNLKELTWYCAEMEVLKQLPAPHALTRLRIKILSSEVMELGVGCASALALFQGLKELFVGIYVTEDNEEDLSDLKEFFCCWWANSSIYDLCELEEKEGFEPVQPHREKTDYLIQAFPKLTSLGLQWVPNKFLFILQKREQICHQLEELSFGCADDICAAAYDAAEVAKLDSIFSMAVRKAQERVMPVFNLKRLNLCIRFDNTNVVSTHLHKIFDGIAILFPNLQELGLVCRIPPRIGSTFVQKWFSFKPEEFQKPGVLENFRKMKIHLRCGDCHLTGLHDYVPNNIEDLAISIDYVHDGNPPDNRDIVFFLDRISDAERFENLQKLHVQVTGVQCFEQLVHVIPKIHGSLQEMSILSPAVTLKSDKLLEKIKSCIDGMQYLNCLRLSRSFLEQLLLNHSKYKDTVKQNWRQALVDLADDLEVKRVEIGDLPENLFGINVDHFSGCGQRAEWLFPCSVGSAEAIVDEKAFKDMLCHYEYRNIDHFLQKFNAFRNGQSRREEYDQSVQNLVDASNARLFEESLHEYKDLVNSDDSENSFVVSDEEEVEKESEDELEKFERKLEKKQRRRERRRAKKGLPKRRISTSSEEEIEDRDDDLVVNELHANPEIDDESEVSGNEMIDDEAEEGDPGTSEGEQESEVYITDSEEEDDNVIVVKPKMKRRVIIESDEE